MLALRLRPLELRAWSMCVWLAACASTGPGAHRHAASHAGPVDPARETPAAGPPPREQGELRLGNTEAPSDASTSASQVPVAPEPPERYEALPVPDFLDAVVSLPAKRGLQPVWVATHGAGGAPEHHCQTWRELLGQKGIILCLRGAMMDRRYGAAGGFYYPNHHELEKELIASVARFEETYREQIDASGYVFAGYSQGATMGALLLPKYASTFPRAILIEGGFNEWNLGAANTFKKNGGERVAFVCGVKGCMQGAKRSVSILARAEVPAKDSYARAAGHTYLGPVAQKTTSLLPWLLEGDARWGY